MTELKAKTTNGKKKVGRPKGFTIKQKSPKRPPETRRIPLVITNTQYHYLQTIASKKSLTIHGFILDLVENHLDSKLLLGELEWNIPDEIRPNRELVLILKALMYGELSEEDKLTKEDIMKASQLIGCELHQLIELLDKIK